MKDFAFGREPALWLDALKVGLVMLATFGIDMDHDMQVWILAVGVAVFGLLKGIFTYPFPVTAITDLIQAAGILAIGLGVAITQDQLGSLVVFVTTVMVALQRAQITPKIPARPSA